MDKYIDMTPNWQGVYRWLMHMKKTNPSSYNHLVDNGKGEFEKILKYNEIDLDLYFKTLQPLEFTDLTNAITDSEIEKETGIKNEDGDITVEEEVDTKIEE